MFKIFKPISRSGFVILDSTFPQKMPLAFRNTEINEYLSRLSNCAAYAMSPMQPGPEAWFSHGYGITKKEFEDNLRGYLEHFPENRSRISYLNEDEKYNFKLAYSFFLAETYTLLPFLEKHKIPFVFVLYPGGAFGLNNESSDNMLKKIFSSQYFRGVIVTQKLTEEYIKGKSLCPPEKVTFIYGGITQFTPTDVIPRQYYKKDKKTLDVCFVAAKYSEGGVDKGYDLFIESAKILCKQTKDIMFHVVGGFTQDDIDVNEIKGRIKFYGYRQPAYLASFYSKMDIFLSPNRPFKLYEGNFDGFPLGIDAQYCGVALFVADELDMNQYYTDKKDIILIKLEAMSIANNILHYRSHPDDLIRLANNGKKLTQKLFDLDYQIKERMKFFKKFVNLEYKTQEGL